MGKRSDFERKPRDLYPTIDVRAVAALHPHLRPATRYCEPCAGDGRLIDHLSTLGHTCGAAFDIEPGRGDIRKADALELSRLDIGWGWECFITNPPWSRSILHDLIRHLSSLGPTWLLFDADWPHTKQAAPYLHLLRKIVSVGRLKWIEGCKHTGKDNCAWYLFDACSRSPAVFIGREAA